MWWWVQGSFFSVEGREKAKGHCVQDKRTGDSGFTSTRFMPV